MSWFVLTYNRLLMMTSNIVPALLYLLSVIRLRSTSPSCLRPVVELVTISWGHFYLVCRPEPTIDQLGEELRLVATTEVTFPARRPKVRHASINEALHPVVLLLRLKGDQVHAALPAVVPRVEPVPLGVPHLSTGVLPAHVVVPPTNPVNSGHTRSRSAQVRVSKTEFPFPLFISPAVCREERVPPLGPQCVDGVASK